MFNKNTFNMIKDEINDFIEVNPYPTPLEVSEILDNIDIENVPNDVFQQFYHKDIVEQMYNNIMDQDLITKYNNTLKQLGKTQKRWYVY